MKRGTQSCYRSRLGGLVGVIVADLQAAADGGAEVDAFISGSLDTHYAVIDFDGPAAR